MHDATTEVATSSTAITQADSRETLGAKLDTFVERARGVVSATPSRQARPLSPSAPTSCGLWPVAASAVAMVKAPGAAAGVLVSSVAFLAKKNLCFKLLHSTGNAAAAAVAAMV
ncbi:hypothetical protein HU200_051873 [Digitaria exilis]|uniref:Uncharacterized protein n=1 Tax=Digitaria exilis TaxID=1010633 RepID=A0A835E681_9POAL|nr:hypothetical protein HU200_051873 [Digitaria exilis]